MSSPQAVYAKLLTRAEPGRGYPLWFPEPNHRLPQEYREVGLRIGDVGVVTEHGSFDVFFNICLSVDHPLHSTYGVPDGFKEISLLDHDMESLIPDDHHGRVVAAQSISQRNLTIGAAVATPSLVPAQGGVGFEFASASNEGAILVLPEGADRHDLRNHLIFEEEALKNGKAWYEFALRRLGRTMISSDSLYLITGCHKTSSWSLAAFRQPSSNFNFNAQFTAGPIVNGNINAAYSWQMTSAIPHRIGPQPYDATQKNQTVFIRGYKVAIREGKFHALLRGDVIVSYESPSTTSRKAHSTHSAKGWLGTLSQHYRASIMTNAPTGASGMGPSVSHEIESDVETNTKHQGDVFLLQTPSTKKSYHPSDSLIEHMMQGEPTRDIFVIHDSVWGSTYNELPQSWETAECGAKIVQKSHKKYSTAPSKVDYTVDKGYNSAWVEEDALNLFERALQERLTTIADMEEATILGRAALKQPDHSDRAVTLSNLASNLRRRFLERGVNADLDEVIFLHRSALDLRLEGHSHRSDSLHDLAICLSDRYDEQGSITDLEEAIALGRAALELRPPGHSGRAATLFNLANDLRTRFPRDDENADLNEAISLHRSALDLRSEGHIDRSDSLHSLALCLSNQYDKEGSIADLEEAIILGQAALKLRPPGHSDHEVTLCNLAYDHRRRFLKVGGTSSR